MDQPKTYLGLIDKLRENNAAIEQEKLRLDQAIAKLASAIKSRLSAQTVPGLLWDLAIREIDRIAPLVGIPVSNFAGQARYLRSLCASVAFTSVKPTENPQTDELLKLCDDLWSAMFFKEMLDDLATAGGSKAEWQQRAVAAMTSLLSAVQGELKYVEQAENRTNRIYSQFSNEIISPAIGISVDDAIAGFRCIRNVITERLEISQLSMRPAFDMWKEYERRASEGASEKELNDFVVGHPEYKNIGKGVAAGLDTSETILLFQPSDLAAAIDERGQQFLEAFSFQPGEVNVDRLLPYGDDVVRRRPFARIGNGQYVLLDVFYCVFAPQYRFVECFDTEQNLQRLNKRRGKALEEDAFELFNAVIKPDLVLGNYYIPGVKTHEFLERDLLILKNKTLFLVESKARPLGYMGARQDKLVRIAADIKRTIQDGYDQAVDVIKYIRSTSDAVPFFDSNKPDRMPIAQIRASDIEHVIVIVFLDSYYGFVATDLKPWIKIDPEAGFPWVVDRDTLESIFLKIATFEQLQSFLLWRKDLHGIAMNEDEAVFAGFFLRHGPAKMPQQADMVQLSAEYADIFEAEYFSRRGMSVENPPIEITPPIWTSMKREGNEIVFQIDGKIQESINLMTGETTLLEDKKQKEVRNKIGRNDPCPCGSGRKYKKCCLNV